MSEDGPEVFVAPRGMSRAVKHEFPAAKLIKPKTKTRNSHDHIALIASVSRHHPSITDGFSSITASRVSPSKIRKTARRGTGSSAKVVTVSRATGGSKKTTRGSKRIPDSPLIRQIKQSQKMRQDTTTKPRDSIPPPPPVPVSGRYDREVSRSRTVAWGGVHISSKSGRVAPGSVAESIDYGTMREARMTAGEESNIREGGVERENMALRAEVERLRNMLGLASDRIEVLLTALVLEKKKSNI